MKIYKTNNNTIIKKSGREKRINYTLGGDPFFTWNGRRVRFDTVLRSSYPTTYTDDGAEVAYVRRVHHSNNLLSLFQAGDGARILTINACDGKKAAENIADA